MVKKLIGESRWIKHYKIGHKTYYDHSKILTGEVSVTFDELKGIWDSQNAYEINDFILGFCKQPDMDQVEFDNIVEFVVKKLQHPYLSNFIHSVAKISDKKRALEIITKGINECPTDESKESYYKSLGISGMKVEPRANYYQAIGILGVEEALPLLESEFERLMEHPSLLEDDGSINWVACDCVACLLAILKIKYDSELYDKLLKFEKHPNDDVRRHVRWAKHDIKNQRKIKGKEREPK